MYGFGYFRRKENKRVKVKISELKIILRKQKTPCIKSVQGIVFLCHIFSTNFFSFAFKNNYFLFYQREKKDEKTGYILVIIFFSMKWYGLWTRFHHLVRQKLNKIVHREYCTSFLTYNFLSRFLHLVLVSLQWGKGKKTRQFWLIPNRIYMSLFSIFLVDIDLFFLFSRHEQVPFTFSF